MFEIGQPRKMLLIVAICAFYCGRPAFFTPHPQLRKLSQGAGGSRREATRISMRTEQEARNSVDIGSLPEPTAKLTSGWALFARCK